MTGKIVSGECLTCESTFEVAYEEILVSEELPEHCPFCGEHIDGVQEEYIEDENDDDDEKWD
jgi:hypothetical protein